MSTKIYTGFVLNTSDFFEIHEHIQRFREELKEASTKKIAEHFGESCARMYDQNTVNGTKLKKGETIFNNVWKAFVTEQDNVRVQQVKDSSVDYSFSITLFPHNGKFYGMFYTVQPEFAKAWTNQPYVDDYMYWSNVDPAEDVSNEDWKERGDVWDAIMKNNRVPALNGFTYEVVLEYSHDLPSIGDVVRNIPDLHTRAFGMAKDELFKEYGKGKNISGNNGFKVFRGFVEYLDTDDGKAKLEAEKNSMLTKLRLTIEEIQLSIEEV